MSFGSRRPAPGLLALAALAPKLFEKTGALLGLERKQGILVTGGRPEPSLAFELLSSHGKRRLTSGWSLPACACPHADRDAITTTDRGGLGIAKDLFKGEGLELDLGAYLTQDYQGMFRGEFDPALGVGLSVSF